MQNVAQTAEYIRRIERGGLATVRGIELSDDDIARASVIDRLMCDLDFSIDDVRAEFGSVADPLAETAEAVIEADVDGLVERTSAGFQVTERGRPFLRSICACFDAYLGQSRAQHSSGV